MNLGRRLYRVNLISYATREEGVERKRHSTYLHTNDCQLYAIEML